MRLGEMENPLFLNRKAHVAVAEGNLPAALDLFIKAHQGDPRNVSYIYSIVSIMEKLGMKYEKNAVHYGAECVFYGISKAEFDKLNS